jgi:hypothetical protein
MIDSADRPSTNSNPFDFLISKNQSLFNGFFTRIGATEVVLEWNQPNISLSYKNTTIRFTVNNGQNVDIDIGDEFFTVEDMLNLFIEELNDATTAARFVIESIGGVIGITDSNGDDIFIAVAPGGTNNLATQLNLQGSGTPFIYPQVPDLRPYRYIDFISSQLTYNQNLKDSTTNLIDQNVLVRWYFSYDSPMPIDLYGFPIYMGYEPFSLRRLYNPPKQIAWENNMPIGQLAFQVVGDDNKILPGGSGSQWLMTLQISEN